MRLDNLGTPVVETAEDETKVFAFIDRLVDNIYGRLPKFVRMFLSKDALKAILSAGVTNMANRG